MLVRMMINCQSSSLVFVCWLMFSSWASAAAVDLNHVNSFFNWVVKKYAQSFFPPTPTRADVGKAFLL